MTTAALKKKIIALVGQETDSRRLAKAYAALAPVEHPTAEPEAAYDRIRRAESDFAAGRYMSGEEARERVKTSLKRRKTAKSKAA